MKQSCRETLMFLKRAMVAKLSYVDIPMRGGVLELLGWFVHLGCVSYYRVSHLTVSVFLFRKARQLHIYMIKGDRFRNWYPHFLLKESRWGIWWIGMNSQGIFVKNSLRGMEGSFHLLGYLGWVLRYVSKLEEAIKNLWCDWLAWGSFLKFIFCGFSIFYWFNLFWIWIIIM